MSAVVDAVAAASGPVGVAIGVLGAKFFDRRKNRADAAQVLTETAVALVEPLKEEIAELRGRVETLECENTQTKSRLELALEHIRALRSWIREHMPEKSPPQPPDALGI